MKKITLIINQKILEQCAIPLILTLLIVLIILVITGILVQKEIKKQEKGKKK